MVVGESPIDQTEHFSPLKKKLQPLGSWVVRKASKTDIPDAPSAVSYTHLDVYKRQVVFFGVYGMMLLVQKEKFAMEMVEMGLRLLRRKE